MVFLVEGAADPLTTNLGLHRLLIGPMEPQEVENLRAAVSEFFRTGLQVELDGRRGEPELTDLIIQDGAPEDGSWRSARIIVRHPCDDLPRKVSVSWPGFSGEGVDTIPIVIRVGDHGPPRMFSLFEEEPCPELKELLEVEFSLESVFFSPCESLAEEDRLAGADYLSIMRENLDRLQSALED